jgi:site-specific DNA-methyltransferase (adenine-specific)
MKNTTNIKIFNGDCIDSAKRIPDCSVDLGIYDPPFGLGESEFDKHYKRDTANVIDGYTEAPEDYDSWTEKWMTEAKRVMKPNGSMYVIMGHTNLRSVLNAANKIGLHEINHMVWKYNFGVYTKKKYVTSHYHILYYSNIGSTVKVTFNPNCRFGSQEKDDNGGSLLYKDLEDVFVINKEFAPSEKKNQNKLPNELIKKLILYSSNEGDMVCDFFMGNFTTAYCSIMLGRNVCGYEINKNSFDYHIDKIDALEFGSGLKDLRLVNNIVPLNQGKPISENEENEIYEYYCNELKKKKKKKVISEELQQKFQRGKFSIKNILDKMIEKNKMNE